MRHFTTPVYIMADEVVVHHSTFVVVWLHAGEKTAVLVVQKVAAWPVAVPVVAWAGRLAAAWPAAAPVVVLAVQLVAAGPAAVPVVALA